MTYKIVFKVPIILVGNPNNSFLPRIFESYWSTGGHPNHRDKEGNVMNSLKGIGRFQSDTRS